jgi:hypothetical protein
MILLGNQIIHPLWFLGFAFAKHHIVLKVERWKSIFELRKKLPKELHQEGNQTIEQGSIVWEPRASTQSEW